MSSSTVSSSCTERHASMPAGVRSAPISRCAVKCVVGNGLLSGFCPSRTALLQSKQNFQPHQHKKRAQHTKRAAELLRRRGECKWHRASLLCRARAASASADGYAVPSCAARTVGTILRMCAACLPARCTGTRVTVNCSSACAWPPAHFGLLFVCLRRRLRSLLRPCSDTAQFWSPFVASAHCGGGAAHGSRLAQGGARPGAESTAQPAAPPLLPGRGGAQLVARTQSRNRAARQAASSCTIEKRSEPKCTWRRQVAQACALRLCCVVRLSVSLARSLALSLASCRLRAARRPTV